MQSHQSQLSGSQRAGFTLIELSIVLVIIGLIVGGVLVGQDLIKAAEIRATVGQVEKYNAAINTFRTKYNGIPGDMVATQAAAFGLFEIGDGPGAGEGDGNGLLEGGAAGAVVGVGETVVFWRHLSDAGLIDGSYGADLASNTGAPQTDATPSLYLPSAKMGRGNFWAAAASNGQNYYLLAGVTDLGTNGEYTFANALTPIESFNIDVKLDDGAPNTGVVQARRPNGASTFGALSAASAATHSTDASASTFCMTTGGTATDTANTYKRDQAAGNSPNCILRFRFN